MPATVPTARNIRSVGIGEHPARESARTNGATGKHHAGSDVGSTFTAHDGTNMDTQDIVSEISELNLTYLMLAQQMLAKDRDAALFRLGISEELADILLTMSPAQIVKLASTNMMLCRFRFDDHAILGLVTQPHRDKGLQQSQMSILLARQAVEQIS